ncbi:hypothetical protein SAMN06295945_0407 [Polynucleobacter meluiroseus]|uniref:Uncharacterized protein n=1 Tax=Polynucleobacter meluiroseus TaxID=1938814 RepID=A0A240DYP5_9BURK|nr:hypothetical protein [Polynucleobacter meluiroseus]SNX28087.1 hypothetical protein SAMN06295945_0407 [Polynucleobacter meluiroseus]
MTQSKVPCCGSGVCIVNDQGECWCGQVWDGSKMVAPPLRSATALDTTIETTVANNDSQEQVR